VASGASTRGESGASDGFVDFRGYRTWYRVFGELGAGAVPLLALHGGPGSTHNYFAPLAGHAPERPVALYDQIGCGNSDRPQDLEWSLELFREEVDAVREQVGLERIHLLGTSWGGMLALEHVLAGARGIVSLVLSSTLASIDEWAEEQWRLRSALPSDEAYFDEHFYRGPKPRAELERMEAGRAPDVYHAMQGPNEWTVTGALRGWDVRERLREIDVPTLVVRGRHDMCTDAIAGTLMNGIRGAREVVLENSSHTPILEETDRYLEVVADFLRQSETRGGP